jgi:hypothetical protein
MPMSVTRAADVGAGSELLERLVETSSFQHPVAVVGKKLRGGPADQRLVLDQKHGASGIRHELIPLQATQNDARRTVTKPT